MNGGGGGLLNHNQTVQTPKFVCLCTCANVVNFIIIHLSA